VITPDRTFGAARKYLESGKRICALNFASSVTPGGGVVWGAGAQEESLCRISTLYPAICDRETAGAFYDRHRQMIREGKMEECLALYSGMVLEMKEKFFHLYPHAGNSRESWKEMNHIDWRRS
jgi:uncharacterized protein (TIGR02452 family)